MEITEINELIAKVKKTLLKMQTITSTIQIGMFKEDEHGLPFLEGNTSMYENDESKSNQLQLYWKELQKIVPPGFSIDGNLVRHLSFNQACDWVDIANEDIPRELLKIEEYKNLLVLIEYVETLHPEVSRITQILLNGDIDAALKTVYTSLDSRIRSIVKVDQGESTVPAIGKAFKDGVLVPPHERNKDSIRNFLQGVVGYYRSGIVHNPLPQGRNSIQSSLSLFALAHEAFFLLEKCCKE